MFPRVSMPYTHAHTPLCSFSGDPSVSQARQWAHSCWYISTTHVCKAPLRFFFFFTISKALISKRKQHNIERKKSWAQINEKFSSPGVRGLFIYDVNVLFFSSPLPPIIIFLSWWFLTLGCCSWSNLRVISVLPQASVTIPSWLFFKKKNVRIIYDM